MTAGAKAARILVVDDHPIVRLGIRQMLSAEAGLEICGEADSAESAMQSLRRTGADLAIVDLSLAGKNGLELIREMRDAVPALLILVLSMHDESLFAERALRAGARGYITKQQAIGGLIGAIKDVLAGRIYVSQTVSNGLLERFGGNRPFPGGRLGNLTDRELQVFELVGRGSNTIEIAKTLGVSVKTIETYRSNIKIKLHLKDAADLVRAAATWIEQI